MTITTTQKIIRIGSSRGATIPAKELNNLGIDVGDEVEITIRKKTLQTNEAVLAKAQSLLDRYEQDFKNLAQR